MKIGICARTYGEKGGIGVYTRSLLKNMIPMDKNNEYSIFYSDEKYVGTFKDFQNVNELYVNAKNKLYWDQIAVPNVALKEKVDIIFHTKFSVPFFTSKKTAMVVHGSERLIYKNFHPKSDIIYFNLLYPKYLKKASLILAVSNKARDDVIEKLDVDPNKIRTIYLAADPIFRVIKDNVFLNNIKLKYNLPENFLIWVGHIYPGKNIGNLLKAFFEVRKKREIDLVLVGSMRWKYEKDIALIEQLSLQSRVKILGHVEHGELVALYNLAKALVFPSYYESFGIPILEAQACGCPVITSKTGGTPESAGNGALYVEPDNVTSIANSIIELLSSDNVKKSMVEKGFSNIKRFSWRNTAIETIKFLEQITI
jgi:glycosyltransferase involved in cell wall biosynthesis